MLSIRVSGCMCVRGCVRACICVRGCVHECACMYRVFVCVVYGGVWCIYVYKCKYVHVYKSVCVAVLFVPIYTIGLL